MKKLLCALLAASLLISAALCEAASPHYDLDAYGEAVVNDIAAPDAALPEDNNRVFYEIFVGSFSDSDGDGIGDLRGIINRMDYLNDGDPFSGLGLGVEGIWLTPIFSSPSYHKYDVTDFYAVDPAFGTMFDLKELIDRCHERGVKLILDLPINHTGDQNEWFRRFLAAHAAGDTASEYYDFYVWRAPGEEVPANRRFVEANGAPVLYEANFSDSMPEPDFDNAFVRETMLDVAKFYLSLGIDGFRFDAARYIYFGDHDKSADFWQWYIGELKEIKPDLYTVAEVWDSETVIDRYLPMTNCFHFPFSQAEGAIASAGRGGSVSRYAASLQKYLEKLHSLNADAQGVLFISNHDMDRAAGYLSASGNAAKAKMAASLYLLAPGSPFIYYGEEIGLRGSRGGANTDANRRLAMRWGDGDTVRDPEGADYASQTENTVQSLIGQGDSLLTHYKRLLMIRKANPEIARGTVQALDFDSSKPGGFLCAWQGSTVAVLHNAGKTAWTVDLSTQPALSGMDIAAVAGIGGARIENGSLTLDPWTSVVLR